MRLFFFFFNLLRKLRVRWCHCLRRPSTWQFQSNSRVHVQGRQNDCGMGWPVYVCADGITAFQFKSKYLQHHHCDQNDLHGTVGTLVHALPFYVTICSYSLTLPTTGLAWYSVPGLPCKTKMRMADASVLRSHFKWWKPTLVHSVCGVSVWDLTHHALSLHTCHVSFWHVFLPHK